MVNCSSPFLTFMVHTPSLMNYTSMPIRFKSLVCWRVSTVFLANLDTSLVVIRSKCPSLTSSTIRAKFFRLAIEIPSIPSSYGISDTKIYIYFLSNTYINWLANIICSKASLFVHERFLWADGFLYAAKTPSNKE